ncbi:MAG: hypothetical protein H6811_06585 [Phycisphaeraceae bacterium]|nr:hypothetical protein [Phycisphaeraceae bacterium]
MASFRGFGLGGAIAAVAGVGLVGLLGYRAMSGRCLITGACLNSGNAETSVVSHRSDSMDCSGNACEDASVEVVAHDAGEPECRRVCPMSGEVLAGEGETADNLSIVNAAHTTSACEGSCGEACTQGCDKDAACGESGGCQKEADPIG